MKKERKKKVTSMEKIEYCSYISTSRMKEFTKRMT